MNSSHSVVRYDAVGGGPELTYHYDYDGQRMIESRNGSNQLLKQQVWGVVRR